MKNKRKILISSFILLAIVLVLYLLAMNYLKENSYYKSFKSANHYIYSNSYDKIVVVYPSCGDENNLSEVDVTAVSLSDVDEDEVLFAETDGVFCAALQEGTYNIAVTCSGIQTDSRILTVNEENNLYVIRILMDSENQEESERTALDRDS